MIIDSMIKFMISPFQLIMMTESHQLPKMLYSIYLTFPDLKVLALHPLSSIQGTHSVI